MLLNGDPHEISFSLFQDNFLVKILPPRINSVPKENSLIVVWTYLYQDDHDSAIFPTVVGILFANFQLQHIIFAY